MKKLLVTLAAVLVSVSAFAQGTVNFSNRNLTAADGSIYHPAVLDPAGAPASGGTAQLYVVGAGGALTALTPVTDIRTGAAAGYFIGGLVEVPGVAPGVAGTVVRVRAWQGAASYDAASIKGESNDVTLGQLGGVPAVGAPVTPPNLDGLQPFTLVPEPSTIALGVLGAAALLLRRRK